MEGIGEKKLRLFTSVFYGAWMGQQQRGKGVFPLLSEATSLW